MTNKSREKVRKAHPMSEADRKICGFLNRQWVSDDDTIVIGFKFCLDNVEFLSSITKMWDK